LLQAIHNDSIALLQAIAYLMTMSKGGRRSTTWGNSWKHGKTTVIRVPEALADEIIEYARQLDEGDCVLQGNIGELLDEFIELKRQQKIDSKRGELSRDTRSWDMFNQFEEWLKSQQQSS
jgi:hypothetical protein